MGANRLPPIGESLRQRPSLAEMPSLSPMSGHRRELEQSGEIDGLYYEVLSSRAPSSAAEPGGMRGQEQPLVVALPGFLSDGRQLKRLARELGRRCLLVDPLGSGRSQAPTDASEYGWPRQVQRLQQVLAALTSEPVDLLGFSMGGMWAQHAMLAAPGLFASAVLVCSAGRLSARQRSILFGLQALWRSGAERIDVWRVLAPLLFSVEFLDRPSAIALLEMLASDPRSHSAAAEQGRTIPLLQLEAMLAHDALSGLHRVVAATEARGGPRCAVIGSELDILMPPATQRELAQSLGCPLHILKGAGHTVWLEQPTELATILRAALMGTLQFESDSSQLTAGHRSG